MKLFKKIIVILVIIILIIVLAILGLQVYIKFKAEEYDRRDLKLIDNLEIPKIVLNLSDEEKIKKANKKYGEEYCTVNGDLVGAINEGKVSFWGDEEHVTTGTTALVDGRCGICLKKETFSASNHPIMCDECQKVTNRCDYCGKKSSP